MKVNTIICDDCLDVMRDMPDNSVDLVLTDPPYGIDVNHTLHKRTKPSRPNSYTEYEDFRTGKANWDEMPISQECIDVIFRISKSQMIFGANYFCNLLPSGFGWFFWDKINGDGNDFSDGEFAFTGKGIQSKRFSCSVFDGLKGGKDRQHPTQKPLKLGLWCVENYSKPNDLILDTHAGSGTFCVASKMLGRRYIGIDVSEKYCNIARKRLEAEEKGITVKELEKGQGNLF